ncbi:MAG: phospholipid carrier-dependent glycosyltransferase [Candidatus Liptonbacteria bacterium]|nr:phospholipid carrier-dependent glycosyltransferase [Candidatus Liptonbacteria bacterium]
MEQSFLAKKKLSAKAIVFILGFLTLINAGLHLYKIGYPDWPVFDEVHFATYSADYVKQKPHYDIHPPLGKMIYAGALYLSGSPAAGDANFITVTKNKNDDGLRTTGNEIPYGEFPYVLLRIVSALFGLVLPLAFFWFLKSIGIGDIASVLGAGLLILDSALLVETRLILMNGMYLTFAFAGLALFFSRPKIPALAGIIFGLALSVKLVALAALGPVVIFIFAGAGQKEIKIRAVKFLGAAVLVLFLIYVFGFVWFPLDGHISLLKSLGALKTFIPQSTGPVGTWIGVFLMETIYSSSGYLAYSPAHVNASQWFYWPIGQKAMDYFKSQIFLVPNYAMWWAVLLSVIVALAVLPRYARSHLKNIKNNEPHRPERIPLLLLLGYVFALFPHFAFVNRVAFLYHYFPSLLFGIGLLVWIIEKKSKSWLPLIIVSLFALAGFVYGAGCVYGTYCNPIALF